MSSRSHAIGILAMLAIAAFSGCGKNATAPINNLTGEAALAAAALDDAAALADDDVSGTESEGLSLRGSLGETESAIRPHFFWRRIDHATRSFEFAFSDSDSTGRPRAVLVTIHKRLTGQFNIVPASASDSTEEDRAHIIHKTLVDNWERRVLLRRVPGDSDTTRRWRVAAISGVKVLSQGATTHIVSVRIQASGGVDTTITDPLGLLHLRRIPRLASADSLRLTVTTSRNDDVVLFHAAEHRFRFRNRGDNTYTFAWTCGPAAGWRHWGVDVLSHGTVFDDALPYDSERWHAPFRIDSDPRGDYFP